jgi:hypothetical protein
MHVSIFVERRRIHVESLRGGGGGYMGESEREIVRWLRGREGI